MAPDPNQPRSDPSPTASSSSGLTSHKNSTMDAPDPSNPYKPNTKLYFNFYPLLDPGPFEAFNGSQIYGTDVLNKVRISDNIASKIIIWATINGKARYGFTARNYFITSTNNIRKQGDSVGLGAPFIYENRYVKFVGDFTHTMTGTGWPNIVGNDSPWNVKELCEQREFIDWFGRICDGRFAMFTANICRRYHDILRSITSPSLPGAIGGPNPPSGPFFGVNPSIFDKEVVARIIAASPIAENPFMREKGLVDAGQASYQNPLQPQASHQNLLQPQASHQIPPQSQASYQNPPQPQPHHTRIPSPFKQDDDEDEYEPKLEQDEDEEEYDPERQFALGGGKDKGKQVSDNPFGGAGKALSYDYHSMSVTTFDPSKTYTESNPFVENPGFVLPKYTPGFTSVPSRHTSVPSRRTSLPSGQAASSSSRQTASRRSVGVTATIRSSIYTAIPITGGLDYVSG
ncbi:hypothetical protein V493_01111 [Pseudogymnoascus sp. VKM F-4281 (FW-2241)]|nr:hypothetical protein V493_01111 [Pseudogymnoascus sp. VKM F-4281 (FW-2241)]